MLAEEMAATYLMPLSAKMLPLTKQKQTKKQKKQKTETSIQKKKSQDTF